jgi:hypothetical protein
MSQVAISGNASGTGTLTIAAPNTNSNFTLTLPQETTTLAGTDATQTLTNKTLTTPNIDSAQIPTVSGTAPLYMARAWVNFDGTGAVAIRASGNVTSITDNGTGQYTVNFTTAMPDANFSVASAAINDGVANAIAVPNVTNANGFTLSTVQTNAITTAADVNKIYASVFR